MASLQQMKRKDDKKHTEAEKKHPHKEHTVQNNVPKERAERGRAASTGDRRVNDKKHGKEEEAKVSQTAGDAKKQKAETRSGHRVLEQVKALEGRSKEKEKEPVRVQKEPAHSKDKQSRDKIVALPKDKTERKDKEKEKERGKGKEAVNATDKAKQQKRAKEKAEKEKQKPKERDSKEKDKHREREKPAHKEVRDHEKKAADNSPKKPPSPRKNRSAIVSCAALVKCS